MKSLLLLVTILFISALCGQGQESRRAQPSPWARSVVTLEVSRRQYDYYQPWTRKTSRVQKTGLLLDGRQILTTADELFDRTLVRLQKNGRGRWDSGEV